MRQRHAVAKAHIQLSVHTVSATFPPVFRLSLKDGPSSPCSVVSRCCLLCGRRGGKVEKFGVSHGWNDVELAM